MSANITLRLDEKTLRRVKHLAVDRNTSVSAWVGELVTQAVNELDGFARARQQALRDLATPAKVANAAALDREHAHAR